MFCGAKAVPRMNRDFMVEAVHMSVLRLIKAAYVHREFVTHDVSIYINSSNYFDQLSLDQ